MGMEYKNGALCVDKLNVSEVETYSIDNPEWVRLTMDASNKIINGVKLNGETYIDKIDSPTIDEINDKIPDISQEDVDQLKSLAGSNILYGKAWYCCGDSFTEGDFNNSDTPETSWKFQDGKYKGLKKVYPRFIALRNNMDLHLLARCGSTIGLRKDDKYCNDSSFDPYNDTPCCLSSANIVQSETITEIKTKTRIDAAGGFCSFMSLGDNFFTYTENGWVYDTDGNVYDITKVATITGTPSIGDKVKLIMTVPNYGFAQQFRSIESGKTQEECKNFKGYITIWFGINDGARCELGTIQNETVDTFYGALNWFAISCIQKFPLAKIGYIVSNQCSSYYKQAVRDVAQKWGICYLDMEGDIKIPSVSGTRDSAAGQSTPIDSRVAQWRWRNNFIVSASNGHPNEFCHEYQSTFIENWLKTL